MKQVVTFGEVMMRLSPPLNYRLTQASSLEANYGGGDANVAAALAYMGQPAAHVTCFPATELGQAATQHFQRLGVDMQHTAFWGQRLGLYFLEVGASLRARKGVYDRAGSAFDKLEPTDFDWDAMLRNARWLHWTGITPAISAASTQATREAIAAARRLDLTVSADVNELPPQPLAIRPDSPGRDARAGGRLRRRHLLRKRRRRPFPHSGGARCGKPLCRYGRAAYGALSANQTSGNLTTRRQTQSAAHERIKGVLYDGTFRETPFLDIAPVVDRIGGGDAFRAGFIYGLLTYDAP